MANKHVKRCSASLIIREMQINTTIRNYFAPTRMARLKKRSGQKQVLVSVWKN